MPVFELDGERPVISPTAFIHPAAVLIGRVSIGDDCFIAPGAVLRADFGPITVLAGTSIQDNAVVHVSPGGQVLIGADVIVAHLAVLHDVTIGRGCVIGMSAVLLPQVVCEEDVFVAAGAVVPQGIRIPAGKLAAGHPARIIGEVSPEVRAYTATGIEEYKALARLYRATMKPAESSVP